MTAVCLPAIHSSAKGTYLWALTVECNFRASKHATVIKGSLITKVVYICSILLAGESSYLAQAEKKMTVIKPEQTHKMTIIFTQNGPKLSFWGKIIEIS